jgi:hypothetical protein
LIYLDEDLTHEAEAVSGSCMVIRRQVIEQKLDIRMKIFLPIRNTRTIAAVPAWLEGFLQPVGADHSLRGQRRLKCPPFRFG